MKGSVFLNPKYTSLDIKTQSIHKINPLIANDQKYLYFKGLGKDDTLKMTKWEDKVIINCTHLKSYKLILILCQNYRLYVFTENLQEITSITGWKSKYNIAFQYLQQYGSLLMIGAESVEMIKVKIDTNVKKTKFLSSVKFSLKKLSSQPTVAKDTLPWHKGYNINFQQRILYVWSPEAIAFYKLNNLQVLSQSFSLTKKQNPITYAYFSVSYKYTLIGTLNGQIKVWRLPLSQNFQHENVLIHTFYGHTKNVNHLSDSRINQKIVVSSGQDLQVCFWNLQTFELLRKFDLFGVYSQINIKNMQQAFVKKDCQLGQLFFGQSLDFITQVNSPVLMINKQIMNDKIGSIALTLQQNLGIVMQADYLLKGKDINKIQTKNIYPPLKVKQIKQIISSPFVQNQFYLLAQNGQLFKVVVPPFIKQAQGISSKIQQSYNIQLVTDRQKHSLHQRPSYIQFLPILPSEYDSQIRQAEQTQKKSHRSNQKSGQIQSSYSQYIEKYYDLRLLMIGCTRGSVVFLSTKNMSKIYCRLTYHRQRVLHVQGIKQYKTSQFNPANGYLASLCSQNYLKIIKFNHKKSTAQCILTYFTGQQLKTFRAFQTYLVFLFYKGEFQITQIDRVGNSQQICCKRSSVIENHQGEIISLDYEKNYQLLLTSGSDNKIKIWTINKILLFDIILDDGLMYSSFISHEIQKKLQYKEINKIQAKQIKIKTQKNLINDKNNEQKSVDQKLRQLMNRPRPIPVKFDLIIAHSNKLLLFNHIPLSFRPNQIEQINNNRQYLDEQKITIRQVLQSYAQKNLNGKQIQLNKKINISQQKQQLIGSSRKKQHIKTQPNYSSNSPDRQFFSQKSLINKNEQDSPNRQFKKSRIYTQTSLQNSRVDQQNNKNSLTRSQLNPLIIKNKRANNLKRDTSIYSIKKQLSQKPSLITQSSIQQTRKHLKQLSDLRQQINLNRPMLPLIKNKKEDIFDQFMKQKLLHKNVLTRRDITLNRIIMKNIIREHFQGETKISKIKVDL